MANESSGTSTSTPAGFEVATGTMIAISGYTVAAAGVLWLFEGLPTIVRIPLALPLVLFAPGYAVVSALFPGERASKSADERSPTAAEYRTSLELLERAVLAVVASIAVVPMVALAVNPVTGVSLAPVLAGVTAVTVVASAVAIVRSPAEGFLPSRSGAGHGRRGTDWKQLSTDGVTLVALALTGVLLASSVGIVFTQEGGDALRTEFYIEGAEGSGGGTPGEEYDLRIDHHATGSQTYTVVVTASEDAPGDRASAESTSELDRFAVDVPPDRTATMTYRIPGSALDDGDTVRFLLYTGEAPRNPGPRSAHRVLRLSIGTSAE